MCLYIERFSTFRCLLPLPFSVDDEPQIKPQAGDGGFTVGCVPHLIIDKQVQLTLCVQQQKP